MCPYIKDSRRVVHPVVKYFMGVEVLFPLIVFEHYKFNDDVFVIFRGRRIVAEVDYEDVENALAAVFNALIELGVKIKHFDKEDDEFDSSGVLLRIETHGGALITVRGEFRDGVFYIVVEVKMYRHNVQRSLQELVLRINEELRRKGYPKMMQ